MRVGLAVVRGLGDELAERTVAERTNGPYADVADLARRVPGLSAAQLEALATAGAFGCFGLDRREAIWGAGAAAEFGSDRLDGIVTGIDAPPLPGMAPADEAVADLWATGISPDGHPTRYVRERLDQLGAVPAARLRQRPTGPASWSAASSPTANDPPPPAAPPSSTSKTRPASSTSWSPRAAGITTARIVTTAPALLVHGRLEHAEGVVNVIAQRIEPLPIRGAGRSRDFR